MMRGRRNWREEGKKKRCFEREGRAAWGGEMDGGRDVRGVGRGWKEGWREEGRIRGAKLLVTSDITEAAKNENI